MMIQFNLLPDVKIAYIKAERQKRLIVSISTIASIAAVSIFVLMFMFVHVAQKKNINDLTRDIKTQSENLMKTKDLNKILTVQNQLGALDNLHSQRVVASRLFGYLHQVTPANVTISQLEVNFDENTMSITGGAQSLAAINTYADSLKFTKYTTDNNDSQQAAFSDVVLASFSRSEGKNTYTITLLFDPVIFAQEENVRLQVPQMITTRSHVEKPSELFEQQDTGGQ